MVEFALIPNPDVALDGKNSPRRVLLSSLRRAGGALSARRAGVAEKSSEGRSPQSSLPIPSSVPRVGFSKRGVGSVVASCQRSLRPVASASGQVAPKSVLQGTFSKFRLAAPGNKSKRILERLANLRPQPVVAWGAQGVELTTIGSSRVSGSVLVASLLRQSPSVSRCVQ